MKLDKSQRLFLSDKLMDSGNYALAGLVFGQIISKQAEPLLVTLGILLYLLAVNITLSLRKEKRKI